MCFSCVPQPSSEGCRPSEQKPSTDQVLTNTPRGFGVEAGPRLAYGIDVERVDVLAEIHQVGRGGVDREVDDHAATRPAGEQRGEDRAVVVARDRDLLEL